jgi:hypothetical protein
LTAAKNHVKGDFSLTAFLSAFTDGKKKATLDVNTRVNFVAS